MRKFIAEFIGTGLLVFFGCGSALTMAAAGTPNNLLVSLVFGLIVMACAYSLGNISGANLNPAVTLGLLICGKKGILESISYFIAQFTGGIAGAGLLYVFFPNTSLGANGYGALSALGTGMWQAILIEVILSFVFVLAVIGVSAYSENRPVSGLVIGLTLTLVHLIGIPFTGTSVNPARSFGPALIAGGEAMSQVWVFIVAPLVGAALAALVYKLLTFRPTKGKKHKAKNA